MKLQLLASFKEETRRKVIETLKAYDTCQVVQYGLTGREEVVTGTALQDHYTEEERSAMFFRINAEDIFTAHERNENFYKTFGYVKRPQYR